jgi:hypothetical protein
MSSTLEQIREFTTLGEARIFAVETDRGVYKTVRRLSGVISYKNCRKVRWLRTTSLGSGG